MLADTIHLSKSVINCRNDAQINVALNNISSVKMTGLEFQGCTGTNIVSVGHFVIENSRFYSNIEIYGTTLAIVDTTANLKRITFACITITELSKNHTTHFDGPIAAMLSNGSVVTITQSWFIGNSGRLLYGKHVSVIIVFNVTFLRNTASLTAPQHSFVGAL